MRLDGKIICCTHGQAVYRMGGDVADTNGSRIEARSCPHVNVIAIQSWVDDRIPCQGGRGG